MGNKSKRYFFVDLENVHRDGLKGADKLTENDHVRVYYSNPLETVPMFLHRQISESPAHFDYVTVEMPIKNAADCMILLDINAMAKSKKKKDAIFTIVSKDSDFDRPITEMKSKGINVRKISVLCDDTQRPKDSDDAGGKPAASSEKKAGKTAKKSAEKAAEKSPETADKKAEDTADKNADIADSSESKALSNVLTKALDENEVRAFVIEHLKDFDISGDRDEIIEQTVQAVLMAKTKRHVNANLLKIFDSASVKLIYGELKPLIKELPGQ